VYTRGESFREDVETGMRSKPTLTPVLGTALAAVAAGSLLAFSMVAQHAGLGDLTVPGPVTASGPGGSLGAITLPGVPGNPAAAGSPEPSPTASEPTLVASAPAPAPEVAPTAPSDIPAPRDEGPSFDGLEDDRRPTSTTRVGDGELERGWQRAGHGRGAKKKDDGLHAARKGGASERSTPPGHARKSDAEATGSERGNGPPSTPPGHAKKEARGAEHGHGGGHSGHDDKDHDSGHGDDKGHGKPKGHGKTKGHGKHD
jgi:hypothetical protein